jgi:hypothetical protein
MRHAGTTKDLQQNDHTNVGSAVDASNALELAQGNRHVLRGGANQVTHFLHGHELAVLRAATEEKHPNKASVQVWPKQFAVGID